MKIQWGMEGRNNPSMPRFIRYVEKLELDKQGLPSGLNKSSDSSCFFDV
ncbi:MAG: hypothetical protein ACI4EP_02940 [Suilimivivens sp.]|nr:hypothetical protein [Lachnospiraceae bacterium]